MTGADIQAAYFTPFHFIMYLAIILALMIAYYQWKWSRHCATKVRVLVVQPDGSTETEYAPKTGNYVALKIPESDTVRLWPISKLASVDMMYPGDGFIPEFLQKKIKMVIVDSEDWEPMLNRGSYSRGVASPDVIQAIRDLADDYSDAKDDLNELADSVSSAPTRDMIASPAVLGNIMKEKVSELAVSISRETFDRLDNVTRKLDKLSNPVVLYAGLGVIIIALVIIGFTVIPSLSTLSQQAADLAAIKQVLGIP